MPAQGQAVLETAAKRFSDRASWDAYAAHLRTRIQQGAGLDPWPRRTPLNPVLRRQRTGNGYTVEAVAFESLPGWIVTGNLYRPLNAKPPYPAMLATHGHYPTVRTLADFDEHGRFHPAMQARAGTLARLGFVVLAIDMFAYGDGMQLVGQDAHRQPLALTLHLWNAIRALDLLESIDGVDRQRLAVSGESGGGTQSFLLTALDSRIALSVPVVMVSSYFFGGCACESGLPIHRSADHFANNAMIAALAAPRPQLLISNGKDWTKHNPEIEAPFLRKIYGYYGAASQFAHVHLPDEGHDYGPSKRDAMYRFVAAKFGLNLAPVQRADGTIDESPVQIVPAAALRVFDAEFPIPPHALHNAAAIERRLRELQR